MQQIYYSTPPPPCQAFGLLFQKIQKKVFSDYFSKKLTKAKKTGIIYRNEKNYQIRRIFHYEQKDCERR